MKDGAALVVTESVFGMDGSVAPLSDIVGALGTSDVLVVDEAHALGVTGSQGAGLAATVNDDRIVVIGTLSKALGAAGGFVAGPADAIALLARPPERSSSTPHCRRRSLRQLAYLDAQVTARGSVSPPSCCR